MKIKQKYFVISVHISLIRIKYFLVKKFDPLLLKGEFKQNHKNRHENLVKLNFCGASKAKCHKTGTSKSNFKV